MKFLLSGVLISTVFLVSLKRAQSEDGVDFPDKDHLPQVNTQDHPPQLNNQDHLPQLNAQNHPRQLTTQDGSGGFKSPRLRRQAPPPLGGFVNRFFPGFSVPTLPPAPAIPNFRGLLSGLPTLPALPSLPTPTLPTLPAGAIPIVPSAASLQALLRRLPFGNLGG